MKPEDNKSIEPKQDKPKFQIIEKALTLMIIILGVKVLSPYAIALIYPEEVALVAMTFEQVIDSEFWIVLSGLVGTLGVKMTMK